MFIQLRNDGFYLRVSVLNLLQRQIAKDKHTVIKIAAKFFGKEAIKQAIEVRKTALDLEIPDKRKGTHPVATFYSDFFELISSRVERGIELPLFVIVDSSDVPSISTDPSTIVPSCFNNCVKMLNFLVEKQETTSQTPNRVAWPSAPTRQLETIPLVLMNIPEGLNVQNPTKQRQFIKSLGVRTR